MAIARARSTDMVAKDYFSHTQPDGRNVFDILTAQHITWYNAGEIIAWNNYPMDVDGQRRQPPVDDSPGHYAIVISTDFNYVGVGLAVDPVDRQEDVDRRLHQGSRPDRRRGPRVGHAEGRRRPDRRRPARSRSRGLVCDVRLQVLTAGLRSYVVQRRVDGGAGRRSWSARPCRSLTFNASRSATLRVPGRRPRSRRQPRRLGDEGRRPPLDARGPARASRPRDAAPPDETSRWRAARGQRHAAPPRRTRGGPRSPPRTPSTNPGSVASGSKPSSHHSPAIRSVSGLPLDPRLDPADEPVAEQDRQDVVAPAPLRGRDVDLPEVVEVVQAPQEARGPRRADRGRRGTRRPGGAPPGGDPAATSRSACSSERQLVGRHVARSADPVDGHRHERARRSISSAWSSRRPAASSGRPSSVPIVDLRRRSRARAPRCPLVPSSPWAR